MEPPSNMGIADTVVKDRGDRDVEGESVHSLEIQTAAKAPPRRVSVNAVRGTQLG